MHKLALAVFLAILIILQVSVLSPLFPFGTCPNLFLIAVAWMSFKYPRRRPLLAAATGGFFLDLISYTPAGINTLGLVAFALLSDKLIENFFPKEENTYLLCASVVGGLIFFHLTTFVLQLMVAAVANIEAQTFTGYLGPQTLWQIANNIILLFPLTWLGRKMLGNT